MRKRPDNTLMERAMLTRAELDAMRCLTVAQPMASAIMHGGKRVENRPTRLRAAHLPRLVVDGLTLDLEKSADDRENWDIAAADNGSDEAPDLEKLVYPLVDFIALTDIAVTYEDHESGKVTELLLHRRFNECGTSKSRTVSHLTIFYGCLAFALVTGSIFIGTYAVNIDLPLASYHPLIRPRGSWVPEYHWNK